MHTLDSVDMQTIFLEAAKITCCTSYVLQPNQTEMQNRRLTFCFPLSRQFPDYYDVIKEPINLLNIKEKVRSLRYESVVDFVGDVRRMFTNCKVYNDVRVTLCVCVCVMFRFWFCFVGRLSV